MRFISSLVCGFRLSLLFLASLTSLQHIKNYEYITYALIEISICGFDVLSHCSISFFPSLSLSLTHTCARARRHTHAHTQTRARAHARTHTHTHIYIHVYTHIFHPRTDHEVPEREQKYSSTLALTPAIDRVGGNRHARPLYLRDTYPVFTV